MGDLLEFPAFELPPAERAAFFKKRVAERPGLTPEQDAEIVDTWLAFQAARDERRRREARTSLAA